MKKNIIIFILIAFIASSCYYYNAEDLYSDNNQNTSNCDTLNVTYNVQIKPLFDNKCIGCHCQGGTYPVLDNFSDAHTYTTTTGNQLYNKVSTNHNNINLNDCEIAQIKKWINTGAN